MSPEKITEINSMIADFMGWEKLEDNLYMVPNLYPMDGNSGETSMHSSSFGFDCSIDWLAPVVNKFLSFDFNVTDDQKTLFIQIDGTRYKYVENVLLEMRKIQKCLSPLKITQPVEDIYNEVAAAVEWYHDAIKKLEKIEFVNK